MFKPVHGLDGYLTAALGAADTTMQVDEYSLCALRRVLSEPGDWTYLLIRTVAAYEVIKVTAVPGPGVTIERAVDGTTAAAWAIQTAVLFYFTESAIADIITAQNVGEIELKGSGIVEVTKVGANEYQIHAPPISIVSESDKILVGGEFPNFVISSPLVSDCCG